MKYVFFSTDNCPNCRIAKKWVQDKDIEYETLKVNDPRIQQYGLFAVPTIIKLDGDFVVDRLSGLQTKEKTLAFFD